MPSVPLPMGSDFDSQSVAGSSYHSVMAGFRGSGTGLPPGGAPALGVVTIASPAATVTATARTRNVLR